MLKRVVGCSNMLRIIAMNVFNTVAVFSKVSDRIKTNTDSPCCISLQCVVLNVSATIAIPSS